VNNHIGDTNKMVRDTPRLVDQILLSEKNDWTANAEIERLTNKVAQLYEGAEEAKQRIKRLESVIKSMTDVYSEAKL